MSSGATSVLPPPKPWERNRDSSMSTFQAAPSSSIQATAPPLPPSLPPVSSTHPYTVPYSAPYTSPYSAPYTAPYSSLAYNHYGSSPYPSYSLTQNINNHPFPAYSVESTTRPLLDSLNHIIQAVNHVACFLDSTVFSVWSAVSAITGLIGAIKNIKDNRWLLWLKSKLKSLRAMTGRKRIILLSIILSAALVTANLFKDKQSREESSLLSSNGSAIETSSIAAAEDELTFVRANYALEQSAMPNSQLSFQAGDVIAISKADSTAVEDQISTWIVGRMKDGRSGFFPSNYVSIIK
jgi:hypothetical protein